MLEFCGALLVLGVGGYVGIEIWKRMQRRAQLLSKFTTALELLNTEIAFLQTPLPQAAQKVSRQTDCELLHDFAKRLCTGALPQSAMQTAVKNNSALNTEDVQLLVQIAGGLGCSDIEAQKRHIDSAVKRMEMQTAKARETLQNNGRLCVGAGVLGSLLLVILLW